MTDPRIPATQLSISGTASVLTVSVGGHMLPCSSATLYMAATDIPVLVIELPLVDGVAITLDGSFPQLMQDSRDALIAMGWTPPDPR